MINAIATISLYQTDISQGIDKEYHLNVVEENGGFNVYYRNGKRGQATKSKALTTAPIPRDAALKLFDSKKRSKLSDGYSEDVAGTVYQSSEYAGRATGFTPQYSNKIDEDRLDEIVHSDDWMMQQKMDGERRPVINKDGNIIGANKDGLSVPLPEPLVLEIKALGHQSILIDSEIIGEIIHVFDILEVNGVDLKNTTYRERYARLLKEIPESPSIKHVWTAFTSEEKLALIQHVKDHGQEGVVGKRLDSIYTPGRPNSGGDHLKFKFFEECSALVTRHNGTKRSVGLALLDEGQFVDVGNVTIPENVPVPGIRSILEVKYLNANRGGSLFTTVYHKPRPDLEKPDELSSLKFKEEHVSTRTLRM